MVAMPALPATALFSPRRPESRWFSAHRFVLNAADGRVWPIQPVKIRGGLLKFLEAGYLYNPAMDHFAKENDELAVSPTPNPDVCNTRNVSRATTTKAGPRIFTVWASRPIQPAFRKPMRRNHRDLAVVGKGPVQERGQSPPCRGYRLFARTT